MKHKLAKFKEDIEVKLSQKWAGGGITRNTRENTHCGKYSPKHMGEKREKKKNKMGGDQFGRVRRSWAHFLPRGHQNYNYWESKYLWEQPED